MVDSVREVIKSLEIRHSMLTKHPVDASENDELCEYLDSIIDRLKALENQALKVSV